MNARLEAATRAAPAILFVLLVTLAGWLAARWTMYWLTPTETPAVRPNERVALDAVAQIVAEARLFGAARVGGMVSNLNIKLKGVFADEGAPSGWAILNSGGKDETAQAGREIAPGVMLESVHPRHVVVRRDGALERVNLEERRIGATAAATPLYTPPSPVPPAAASLPSVVTPASSLGQGSMLPRYRRGEPMAPVADQPTDAPPALPRYRRGEPMAPVADQPADAPPAQPPQQAGIPAAPQVASSPQGLVVQTVPPGSMLERLGLQPGDVVRSVNGEQVRSEADVVRIVQSRGLQASYSAEVLRGGQTIALAVNVPR